MGSPTLTAKSLGLQPPEAGILDERPVQPGDGTSSYTVHQGIEMHRPSLLECTVTAESGTATTATVSGHVVPIARGDITVPPFLG